MDEFQQTMSEHYTNCFQSYGLSEDGSHQLASGERPSDPVDQAMLGSWDAQQPTDCFGNDDPFRNTPSGAWENYNPDSGQTPSHDKPEWERQGDIANAVSDSRDLLNFVLPGLIASATTEQHVLAGQILSDMARITEHSRPGTGGGNF